MSLQTTSAVEIHLAEEQHFLEQQTLTIEKSLIYRAVTRKLKVPKTEGQNLEPL
jgi:hypothetical protein